MANTWFRGQRVQIIDNPSNSIRGGAKGRLDLFGGTPWECIVNIDNGGACGNYLESDIIPLDDSELVDLKYLETVEGLIAHLQSFDPKARLMLSENINDSFLIRGITVHHRYATFDGDCRPWLATSESTVKIPVVVLA